MSKEHIDLVLSLNLLERQLLDRIPTYAGDTTLSSKTLSSNALSSKEH